VLQFPGDSSYRKRSFYFLFAALATEGNKVTETLTLNRQDRVVTFKLALAPIKNGDETVIAVSGSVLLV